ncbi:ADP-ribosylglycohydrolase family protein [Streptomyces sp. NPDC058157]|uniref:ADP-ribosylglycohydrolase family protein n=1 Tax=Streptomyces sp. NPDC058157 TaxID=3346360 RepID=UPI0036E94F1C
MTRPPTDRHRPTRGPGRAPAGTTGHASAARTPAAPPGTGAELVRLTWAQPEDLVGHELRQAAEDGRDAGPLLRTWLAAGGRPAPARAGASPTPAGPELRALATRLLDELAALPVPSAADEPTSWPAIRATWPTGAPSGPPAPTPQPPGAPSTPRRPGPAAPPQPAAAVPHQPRADRDPHRPTPQPAGRPDPAPRPPGTAPALHDPALGPRQCSTPDPATPHTRPGSGTDRGGAVASAPDPQPGCTPSPTAPHTPPAAAPDGRGGTAGTPGTAGPGPGSGPGGAVASGPGPRPGCTPSPATPHTPPGSGTDRGATPGGAVASGAGPQPGRTAAGRVVLRTRPEPGGGAGPGDPGLCARLEAAWVGRAVGCVLGKPVEKLPLHGIRALARAAGNWPLDDWFTARGVPPELLAAHPWNRRSAATSLAENIDGTPEDDDLNHPLLGLLLLQRHGRRFTTADLGRLWLDELPAGRAFTAERIAYRNLLLGLEPPLTAGHHNPFREWIGALIRADVHGWTNPGDPAAAAEQAWRDASLSHTATGVHAALFAAATVAEAASGRADVHGALRAGLAVVPPRSRLAEAVRFGIRTARAEGDFERVVDLLHARYGGYHWVHALPNTALIAAALTHADGDFTRSVCGAVSGGWDTDSNGATAGSVAGLLAGSPDRIPERWTAPLGNRLSTTVAGFDGVGFDTLARLTAQEAARP